MRVLGKVAGFQGQLGNLEEVKAAWVQGGDPGVGQRTKGVPGDVEGPVNLAFLAVFGSFLDTSIPLYLQGIPKD